MASFFTQTETLFFDEPMTSDVLHPFALTDYFLNLVQIKQQPILHFWQLPDTFILGMKDARVPNLERGLAGLTRDGLHPVIRNAGGLGVINDSGILNISLFLHNPAKKMSIDAAYLLLTGLIQYAYGTPTRQIKAYEIKNSYCPGKFDLSIDGLKIAGIAQRRFKEGIAVMAYLSISGDQNRRGEIVRDFYQTTLGADFGTNGYPAVDPASMTTLDTTIDLAKEKFATAFEKIGGYKLDRMSLPEILATPDAQNSIAQATESLVKRNAELNRILVELS